MPEKRPPYGESRRELVASISDDLRGLVSVLNGLFEREIHDGEALLHLLNAKSAAERGLVLSQRLADLCDGPDRARYPSTH